MKPYSIEELAKTLRQALGGASDASPPPTQGCGEGAAGGSGGRS
jgi:hypothetical protein